MRFPVRKYLGAPLGLPDTSLHGLTLVQLELIGQVSEYFFFCLKLCILHNLVRLACSFSNLDLFTLLDRGGIPNKEEKLSLSLKAEKPITFTCPHKVTRPNTKEKSAVLSCSCRQRQSEGGLFKGPSNTTGMAF